MSTGLLNYTESQYALHVAFLTMKERCKQLHSRLTKIEEENIWLREEYEKNNTIKVVKFNSDVDHSIEKQQAKIQELTKQKLQLSDHIFMICSENKQLWKWLSDLFIANKFLSNQFIKVSDTLKKAPLTETSFVPYNFKEIPGFDEDLNNDYIFNINKGKEYNSEKISLRFTSSDVMDKSELDHYKDIIEWQTQSEINFNTIGFTCPDNFTGNDSLEELKYHDLRLSQIKEALLDQQYKFRTTLQNIKKHKSETCEDCQNNVKKLKNQSEKQFCLKCSSRKIELTKMTVPASISVQCNNTKISGKRICPLCGMICKKSISFTLFHAHVISHLTNSDNYIMKI